MTRIIAPGSHAMIHLSVIKKAAMERRNSRTQVIRQGGGIYGLGFIGALIYFIQQATSFWMGAIGVMKAIVWPAVCVYKMLEHF